jgi:hypothetical protein
VKRGLPLRSTRCGWRNSGIVMIGSRWRRIDQMASCTTTTVARIDAHSHGSGLTLLGALDEVQTSGGLVV